MKTCRRNHEQMQQDFKFCPYCGVEIKRTTENFPDTFINEALLAKAMKWTGEGHSSFFIEVLKFPARIAYPLARARVSPEELVTMSRDKLLHIRMIGEQSAQFIINSRCNYSE